MADQISFSIVINGAPQVIKSINDIDLVTKNLTKAYKAAQTQAERTGIALQMKEARGIKTSMMGVTAGMKSMSNQTAQAGVTMQNMNFVIRDSPFFFKDLQLGVLAVGNNINPLIDSFQRLKIQAAEMNKTAKQSVTAFSLLRKSMAGPMGLSIAMSLVVTAFQAVVFSMDRAKDKSDSLKASVEGLWSETFKATEEFKKFVEEIKKFNAMQLEESLRGVREELERVREELSRQTFTHWDRFSLMLGIASGKASELAKELKELLKQEKALNDALNKGTNFQEMANSLRLKSVEQIKEWAKANHLSEDSIDEVRKALTKMIGQVKKGGGAYEQLTALLIRFDKALNPKKIKKVKEESQQLFKDYADFNEQLVSLVQGMERFFEIQRKINEEGFFDPFAKEREFKLRGTKDVEKPDISHILDPKLTKEAQIRLQLLGTLATTLGNQLSQAFLLGKVSLDQLIKSMGVLIAQMLVIQSLKFLFGAPSIFGAGGSATDVVSGAVGRTLNKGVPQVIQIEGTSTMNSRQFITEFKRAETQIANRRR
ncbi:MAG: hypothetical protein GY804_09795 [Alphaproteobacteria bacterium]|nr:hypothetical protein [Alphaproteobacteria bacterium]